MTRSKRLGALLLTVAALASPLQAQDQTPTAQPELAPGFTSDHPGLAQWHQHLAGKRLTQIDSYYSSGGSVGGYSTGGGYSSEIVLHLCSDKTFFAAQQSSTSVDSGGAFGSGQGANQYKGNWMLITNGQVVGLILMSDIGGRSELTMEFNQGQTFVNGVRTFVTEDANCP